MAPKKKPASDDATVPARTTIRAKTPQDWSSLIRKASDDHWRRLRVTIQVREWLMAGKPASLDAANAMLKARGLEDHMEAVADIEDPHERAQAAERVAVEEGLCEFSRRPGKPGLWIPANNIKAGFKENWSVVGLMNTVRGSRKAIAEGVFIFCADSWEMPTAERDWIYVGPDDPKPLVHTSVSHSIGPKGPMSSIKRNEYVVRPIISFDMYAANASSVDDKLDDADIAKALVHFAEHGLGACRSQGYGKFDIVEVREVSGATAKPDSIAA